MNRLSGIPFCFRKTAPRLFSWISVVPFLLVACFSGQTERQAARDKLARNGNTLDLFRLTQITVPTNAAYSAVLSDLNRNDLLNIDRAITLFTSNKADSLSRDSMLISFNEFMSDVMQEYYSGNMLGNQKLLDQFLNKDDQGEAKKLTALLAKHGIKLTFQENDFYLEPDLEFVQEHLEGALSSGSRNYLQTKISLARGIYDEDHQPFSKPDSLSYLMIAWEDFMAKNPGYVLRDEILAQYIDALTLYLTGLEQLPLFDPETKLLTPEYKASYLRYLEKYPDRESTKTVKKFYELLASKGFKYDESMDTFLSEVNFIPTQLPQ